MRQKRSYSGDPASPRLLRAPHVEAARWLASRAKSYADDRATIGEVEEAFFEWQRVAQEFRKHYGAAGIQP